MTINLIYTLLTNIQFSKHGVKFYKYFSLNLNGISLNDHSIYYPMLLKIRLLRTYLIAIPEIEPIDFK
jgi:hypothetical protein